MKEHFTPKKLAYGFSVLFIISTFCTLAINSEFKHFMGHKSSGPWEDTYPHTYKALCANIAFDAFNVIVIVGFWYFLVNNELSRYYLAYAIVALSYGVLGRFISGIVYLTSPDDQDLHDNLDRAFDLIHDLDHDNIPSHLKTWKLGYKANIVHLVLMIVFGTLLKVCFVKNQNDRKRLIVK